jgi:hypothetical protein
VIDLVRDARREEMEFSTTRTKNTKKVTGKGMYFAGKGRWEERTDGQQKLLEEEL